MISWDSIGPQTKSNINSQPETRNCHTPKIDPQGLKNQGLRALMPKLWDGCEFVLYVDADEFLFIPPEFTSLRNLYGALKDRGTKNLISTIVEFFPACFSNLNQSVAPKSLIDLLDNYPYFESEPLLRYSSKSGFKAFKPSKTTKLFQKYDIRLAESITPSFFSRLRSKLYRKKQCTYRQTPRFKTPVIYPTDDSFLTGTHRANLRGDPDLLLTIAHFVYTSQLLDKIDRARQWRSYANNSEKYDLMKLLVDRIRQDDSNFIERNTMRFNNVSQFLDCGLMINKLRSS
jgi:hypothetical protein